MSSNNYASIPFEWDRPGQGLYANGEIRVLWRDQNGEITLCRMASDKEVLFITMVESLKSQGMIPPTINKIEPKWINDWDLRRPLDSIDNIFRNSSDVVNGPNSWRREIIFEAMKESGFERTTSCCEFDLEKMCRNDVYRGNLEVFANTLFRLMKKYQHHE